MTKNILLAGVGGQGTILCAKLLTAALMEAGCDVKMSEIHGMSQRGGDVVSQVRYGDSGVFSPVIEKGTCDIIVAFEKQEAVRNLDYLAPGGMLVVNDKEIDSMTVLTGQEEYPSDTLEFLNKAVSDTVVLDADAMALELGNIKVANVILLGALVKSMGLTNLDWDKIITDNVKSGFAEINRKALRAGMAEVGDRF